MPTNYYYDGATPDVRQSMAASLAVLKSLGARIVELAVPDPQEIHRVSATVSQCEAAAMHARWMRERPQDYSLYVRSRVEAGYHIPATTYLEALNLRPTFLAEFLDSVYTKVDVLHTPVMVMPPPTIAESEPKVSGDVAGLVAHISRNTRPSNYLGLPALSVPGGFGNDYGRFQLVGRPFAEAKLSRRDLTRRKPGGISACRFCRAESSGQGRQGAKEEKNYR